MSALMPQTKTAVRHLTDTGYPTGISKINPAFRGDHFTVLACGDNLDAPEALLSGTLFWGPLLRDVLPGIAAFR